MTKLNEPIVTQTLRSEATLFERHFPGKVASTLPPLDVPRATQLKERDMLPLPELTEIDVVRHFTRLSRMNAATEIGIYPLGSCTMKYNPRINEEIAAMDGFKWAHPQLPQEASQGLLEIYSRLEKYLCAATGLYAASLIPAAGAHGEWTGIRVIQAALRKRGNIRKKFLIPESAHGTNPASCSLCQYEVVKVPAGKNGIVEASMIAQLMDDETAGLMITNPNTLGLFESELKKISAIVHERGGFVYMDGANFNALLGHCLPADLGIDVMHINLHKTFSTPHGGGGPGAGPICVVKELEPFLPTPVVKQSGGSLIWDYSRPESIGRIRAGFGNFLVLVKAAVYIESLGEKGMRLASETAILNANYIKHHLKEDYYLPFDQPCMHEVVFSDRSHQALGIKTTDIAKRLIDFGMHPPTMYFPLVIPGSLMIEPTESETLDELQYFIRTMKQISQEAKDSPELVKNAPHHAYRKRVDEVLAAKTLVLNEPISATSAERF